MRKNKYMLIIILTLAAVLRLYQLGSVPAGLYTSEVEIGYNAYTIVQTGNDQNGEFLPILFNNAYADATPLYTYLTIPFIALFGLNLFTVRAVSAIAGILATLAIYYIVKLLQPDNHQHSTKIPFIAAALYAVNPWSLHMSRAAVEINLAVTLVIFTNLFLLKYIQHTTKKMLFLTIASAVLAIYTYISTALFIIPQLLLAHYLYTKKISIKYSATVAISLAIVCAPLLYWGVTQPTRYQLFEPFVFNNSEYYLGPYVGIMQRYAAYFSPDFLFFAGDPNAPRHSIQGSGLFYIAELITIVVGCMYTFKNNFGKYKLLFLWLLLAPFSAATSTTSPDAFKSAFMLPPLIILSALGINYIINTTRSHIQITDMRISVYIVYTIIATYATTSYIHLYYVHYTPDTAWDWREHITKTAQYIGKMNKSPSQRIIIEATKDDILYLRFFEAQYNNTRQKYQYTHTQAIQQNELNNNDIVAIAGWKGAPDKLKNIREIQLSNGKIGYKVGIWQK